MPTAAKANASRVAPGIAKIAQGDLTRPSSRMTTMNPKAYSVERITAHPISPRATSPVAIGVARTAS
jgi:hypothetical protein